jgi:hypothetical protein
MLTATMQDYANAFTDGYVTCGLRCDTYNEDGELVQNESDERIEGDSWTRIREVCDDFVRANWEDLEKLDAQDAGHNFWLTQNRHGAGFWDRGLGELGDRLTAASHPYGEAQFFADDDFIRYEG